MTRDERIEADRRWNRSFGAELAGARRRALTTAINELPRPTLRDLLVMIGEGRCDLDDTPTAARVRLGDLVGRDGEGQFLDDLIRGLGLGLSDPLGDAEARGLDELSTRLVDLLE